MADQTIEHGERGEGKPAPSAVPPAVTERLVNVWPHLLYRELLAALVCLILLLAASILFDAPLEDPADPAHTPSPAKAPWYFVGFQELLVYFDPWIAGVVIPLVITFGLCAIPYVDGSRRGEGIYALRERPLAFAIFTGGLAAWCALIAIGTWFRGPGWAWVWPWEPGAAEAGGRIGRSLPNAVGVPLLAAWFGAGGLWIVRRLRGWPGLTLGRRVVIALLALAMAGVGIKIAARLLFGLKYIVAFRESGFNI